jgi:hypothetical protein
MYPAFTDTTPAVTRYLSVEPYWARLAIGATGAPGIPSPTYSEATVRSTYRGARIRQPTCVFHRGFGLGARVFRPDHYPHFFS